MNNKIKDIFKLGLLGVISTFAITSVIVHFSSDAEAATRNPTAAQWPVAGNAIGVNITKGYSFASSAYSKINLFPIDEYVFNSDADYFCAEHGTSYGGQANHQNTVLGNNYHEYATITKHNVAYGSHTSDPKGDINTSAEIYLDRNGNRVENLSNHYGYREHTESPTETIYTNWVYTQADKTFDCESNGGHGIKDGGMAYLLAVYKQSDSQRKSVGYEADPLQHAVWSWLGQLGSGETNPLGTAASKFQDYHAASENPKVDTLPSTNVGTTLSGSNYVVGPFTMSNYVRAQDYTYSYGSDTSVQSAFNRYNAAYQGTIIKAEAVVKNEGGATKRVEFPVPAPGSTYNINLSSAAIDGYDELVNVVFTYQRIHSSGNGTMYYGYQEAINYSEESYWQSGCTYYCQDGTGSGNDHFHKSPGSSSSPYSGSCTHTWYTGCWYTCPGHHHSETTTHADGSTSTRSWTTYCSGCVHHYGTYHSYTHSDPYKCPHGHENCKRFQWTQPSSGGDYAQDAFAGSGALTNETIEYTVNVSVPLKTKMKLYKYITSVDHVGESGNIFNSTARRENTMDYKAANTVKVERGDQVTYTIEIVNDSRFPTRVKVKDTLPGNCDLVSCDNSSLIIPNHQAGDWLTVNAKSTVRIILKVRPTKDSGKDTNTLEFVTTNTTNPHMQYTTWGSGSATHGVHRNGSIVNTYTKEKDSDTYEIKEYNVSIEKYISDVTHNPAMAGLTSAYDSTKANDDSRYSKDEGTKQAQPIYVEYGDTVTYKIKVYNTTNSYKDFNSRDSAPYWAPDKIYVNIEDTLPKKYSDIHITADNGNNGTFNVANGKFTYNNLKVPANGITTITVTLKVEEHVKDTIEVNSCKFTGTIKNINYSPSCNAEAKYRDVKNNSSKTSSSDWYKLNYYNSYIDKYVYKYDESVMDINNTNKYTNETSISNGSNVLNQSRERISDSVKKNNPVSAENSELIWYNLKVTNDQVKTIGNYDSGERPATQVRPTTIVDKMQKGLTYQSATAKIYKADGSVKNTITENQLHKSIVDKGTYMQYTYTVDNKYILDPGEYLIIEVKVKITESNMYLYDLYNSAETALLTNINNTDTVSRPIKNNTIDENFSQELSTDYVRMKDLVISGQVWLDLDRNGYMNDNVSNYANTSGFEKSKLETYYNINDNSMKKDIVVKLYQQVGNEGRLVRTTLTDENGLFTFARDENLNYYSTDYTYSRNGNTLNNNFNGGIKYQRVDKATGKDSNGNYANGSTYNSYYIEYEYDGVLYKSTEVYSGMKNLDKNDGGYNSNYLIDSNAKEFTNVRENFNKNYEYITYDAALNDTLATSNALEFDKTNHTSQLLESNNRIITARSFITSYNTNEVITALRNAMNNCGASSWKTCSNHYKHWQTLISLNIIDASKYPNTTAGRQAAQAELRRIQTEITNNANASGYSEIANLLWLYSFDNAVDNTIPKTDYLKHINLGLELREDVDVTLTKDVYKVTTTLNGEEIEYDFNQNNGINGEMGNGADNSYLKDYISNAPYGITLYESDFKQRIEQYEATAVRDYKGIESELNVEVTYRISINNNATTDDDNVKDATDTKLKVKASEILDLYDTTFKQYKDGEANVVNVRQMDPTTGMYGEDRKVAYAEAWYYKKLEGNELLNKDITRYTISNDSAYKSGEKPIYIQNSQGEYKKVPLNVSQTSKNEKGGKYTTKANNFTNDGYYTLYITGMDGEYIDEGSSLDIYVKYVLDKDDTSTIVVDNEELETEIIKADTTHSGTVTYNGYTYTYNVGDVGNGIKTTIKRTLRIAEKIVTDAKNKYGRGTENFAQVNAYSVWYDNNKPASIVDKDSNAGNIGETNSTISRNTGLRTKITRTKGAMTSADYVEHYEDTAYKTGVEIMVKNSENDLTPPPRYPAWFSGFIKEAVSVLPNRKIEGTVWDDSRTDTLGTSNNDTQYIGDGKLDTSKSKNADAKSNENVNKNYKDGKQTEDKDLLVRNAKAEYIEIVQTKDDQYYEQKLKNVTWPAVQSIRTDENGKYTLEGMVPGRYIVRFTYGDIGSEITTVDNNVTLSDVQKDNLIFNGQDYKSTLNNLNLDGELDDDKILTELQKSNISDARDDELRRLEVNSYSEVMTSSIAEILKGLANGSITRNSQITNTADQLNELSSKTAMQSETVEFLVKPEKATTVSETYKSWVGRISIRTGQGLKDDSVEVLYKELVNMDYKDVLSRTYDIENIDLGVEYRPEAEISLEKEIEEIKLVTNDNNVLIDLFFKTEGTNENKVHKIVEENSIGFNLVQFGTNDYTKLLSNLDTEEFQGYVYLQVDPEILQGSKVEISYKFIVQNYSEIDRVRDTLNYMRMKNNPAVEDYTASDTTLVNSDRYTASETARNILYKEIYKDIADKDAFGNAVKTVFRNRKKELVNTSLDTTTNALQKEDYKGGYFGKFVGYSYYAGKLDDTYKDVISELKFDKILDYVDTDLEYDATVNGNDLENKYWAKTTTAELEEYVLRARKMAGTTLNDSTVNTNGSPSTDLDIKNSNAAKLNMTNVSGVIYDNLVVSVSNRVLDSNKENDTYKIDSSNGLDEVYNKDMDKFMTPAKYDEANSKGTVYLPVSKVVASETDTNNMSYENIAEIIQYTTLTGRRTNFATTIGNADITTVKDIDPDYEKKGSEEFATASFEADTAGTETITFTPPTGLMKNRKVIVNAVETAKVGVGVIAGGVAVVFVGIFVTNFAIRKYKKRRIK